MYMKVFYGLSPVGLAINHKTSPVFGAALFFGQFLGLVKQSAGQETILRFQLHDIPDMLFGDQEEMNRRLGGDVVEGQKFIIFIDLLARNLPRDDFTKNAIAIAHKLYYTTGIKY
jgi:hypothetical protein